ncbi:MAG: clan AA aspartic protease [Bacteroidetes bacterium QH_9_64_21]|nr:MAG: clan AA aspartic protease [Bacteroidetes bacterium QH_9_64_21]
MTLLGQVTAGREAVVHLTVEGAGGTNREINAVLDTRFNGYLALPAPLIEALGLQGLGRERVTLASGEIRFTRKYEASVRLAGLSHPVEVVEAGEPLVGMALLWGYEIRIHCIEGGRVVAVERSMEE